MDDAGLVSGGERAGELNRDVDRVIDIKPRRSCNALAQSLAIDELRRDVVERVLRRTKPLDTHIEDRENARMIES